MKRFVFSPVLVAVLTMTVLFSYSCKHDVVVPTSPIISFATDIQPLFLSNCAQSECHASKGNGHEEEAFPLTTYEEVMDHNRIVPQDPPGSKSYTAITSGKMPRAPYGSLTNQQVLKLYVWILQGAKNN